MFIYHYKNVFLIDGVGDQDTGVLNNAKSYTSSGRWQRCPFH